MKVLYQLLLLLLTIPFVYGQDMNTLRFYAPFNNSIEEETFNTSNATSMGITPTTDRFGNNNAAYQFAGTSYISYDHGNGLSLHTYDFTVAAWVKTSSTNRMSICWIGRYANSNGDDGRLGLELNHPSGAGVYAFISGLNNNVEVVSTPDTITDNQWHHVAFVRAQGDLHIYLDGQLVASNTTATQRTVNNTNFRKLHLGSLYNTSGTGSYFDGAMDDVSIFWKALDESAIQELYNATESFEAKDLSAGIVSKIDLDGTVEDSLQRAILTSSTATNTTDRNSNTNAAMAFDGTQLIQYDTDNEYSLQNNPGGQLSVAVWFKSNDTTNRQGLVNIGEYVLGGNSGRLTLELNAPSGEPIKIIQADNSNNMTAVGVTPSSSVCDNQWHHLVYVRENDINVVYLDGQQVHYSTGTNQDINGSKTLLLGGLLSNSSNIALLDGALDEVMIYGRGLHKPEVMALYQQAGFAYQADTTSNLIFDVDFETSAADKTMLNSLSQDVNTSTQTGITSTGTAYSFTGSNSYLQYQDSSILDLYTNKFTVSFWVKSSDALNRQAIICLGRYNNGMSTGHGRFSAELNTPSGEQLAFTFSDDANTSTAFKINPSTNLTDGNWHHIVLVRSGEYQTLFVDGQLEAKQTHTLTDINNPMHRYLYLGALANASPNVFLNGGMDNVKIFKRPLNAKDVTTLYEEMMTGTSISKTPIEERSPSISIAPNPGSTVININYLATTHAKHLQLMNSAGQQVAYQSVNNNQITLDISHLPQGIYFVRIIDDLNNNVVHRFVKE